MPRNFDRRVEVMFPIEAPELQQRICDELIPTYLSDNMRARILMPDGTYVRAAACQRGEERRSQSELLGGLPTPLFPSQEVISELKNGQTSESDSLTKTPIK